MKYLRILIVFTIFFGTWALSAQSNLSGIITYESTINQNKKDDYFKKRDSLIKEKKGEFMIKSLDAVYFNTKPIVSKIVFNNGEGLYKVESDLSLNEKDIGQTSARTSAGGSNEYYYNIKEDTYLIKNCVIGECFIYPNPDLEWELTQEAKEINGYTVFKAKRSEG